MQEVSGKAVAWDSLKTERYLQTSSFMYSIAY